MIHPFPPRASVSRMIYIAAPFDAREAALELKQHLERVGHIVTSNWLTAHTENADQLAPEVQAHEAKLDAQGVKRADVVILLNNVGESTSGGMHVETGIALAYGKQLVVVGERTNVFHHLKGIEVVANQSMAVDMVDRVKLPNAAVAEA